MLNRTKQRNFLSRLGRTARHSSDAVEHKKGYTKLRMRAKFSTFCHDLQWGGILWETHELYHHVLLDTDHISYRINILAFI